MTDRTGAPTVVVRLVPPGRRQTSWSAVIDRCPFCGTRHMHGTGVDGTVLGYRVSPCFPTDLRASYILAAPRLGRRPMSSAKQSAVAPERPFEPTSWVGVTSWVRALGRALEPVNVRRIVRREQGREAVTAGRGQPCQ